LSDVERAEIWRLRAAGSSVATIARAVKRPAGTVQGFLVASGGVRPRQRTRADDRLTLEAREDISRGLAAGESLRAIARRLGRPASTVSREVRRHGGRRRYRAASADAAAWDRARRPKPSKLAMNESLRELVELLLGEDWAPEQIAGWLARTFPDDPEMRVSHETIYLSLFVQAKGALRKELTEHLRSKRAIRRGRGASVRGKGCGRIVDAVNISERPAEADDRAVPGHWEGDLLLGDLRSAIATLVERQSRFVMLVALPDGKTSDKVVPALARHIQQLPIELRRSLTWDRGKEMSFHAQFTIATGVQVFFCDPKSPWQRGSNENTNGLLRQYFPKRQSVAGYSQADLDVIAAKLNRRPRETLGFMTPSEVLTAALQ